MDDGLGGGDAVARTVGRGQQPFWLERGHKREHFVHRQLGGDHAERSLKRQCCTEEPDVVGRVEQEEVAVLAEVDVDAEALLEGFELRQRPQRDPDVELVGELRSDAPCRLARRAAGERVALDEDDVGDPQLREVVRGARTHGATADDYHLCRFLRHVGRNPAVD